MTGELRVDEDEDVQALLTPNSFAESRHHYRIPPRGSVGSYATRYRLSRVDRDGSNTSSQRSTATEMGGWCVGWDLQKKWLCLGKITTSEIRPQQ